MYPILTLSAALGAKLDTIFYGFDVAVFKVFGAIQTNALSYLVKLFSSFGDENFVIPIVVLGILLCFFKRTRKYGFALIFSVGIGALITNVALKPMFERVRPYNTLQLTDFWQQYSQWYKAAGSLSESDFSMPSGHSTSAWAMATPIFICLWADKKKKFIWILPLIGLLTMGSRIYLMVHYPSDVVFGMAAGIISGIIAYFISKLICKLFEKVKFLDKIDAERLFKKGFNTKAALTLIIVFIVASLGVSYAKLLTESNEEKCAYNASYSCNNKARINSDKYPATDIDGDGEKENVCKIHWKEFNESK